MHFTKIFIIFIGLSLAIGFFGCAKEQKMETPQQEQITKDLLPAKAEVKSQNFLVELSDLKVEMFVYIASKEITLEYLDEAGKPIPFKPEERIEKVNPFWETLQPAGITEGSLDVTIPKMAIKEKPLGKIEVKLVYDPSPLKRETLTLSEKIKIE
jgi:hypothetical protein